MQSALKKIHISWPLVFIGVLYSYLGYHTLSGHQGLLKWGEYKQKISGYEAEITQLRSKRKVLEGQAYQLRADHLDVDYLDGRARQILNLSYANEIVIWLDDSP
ncbi:MAG: septum formation initiator family protein [Robiginitomaculum sp.]|nr:septum formation initiator family protein [Robiginitomaculum sp.]